MTFDFANTLVLENETLLLRPLSILDINNLLEIAIEDPLLLQYSPKPVCTPELLTDYIQNGIIERALKTRYSFSIFSKMHQCYVGSTAFFNISNGDDRLEIGATWFGKKFHKTGLNRQGKYLMLTYAFDIIGASRVEFRTDERNIKSRKAIEGIGGKLEGVLRKHTVMYDNFRRNTMCYSILKEEWENLKINFIVQ